MIHINDVSDPCWLGRFLVIIGDHTIKDNEDDSDSDGDVALINTDD